MHGNLRNANPLRIEVPTAAVRRRLAQGIGTSFCLAMSISMCVAQEQLEMGYGDFQDVYWAALDQALVDPDGGLRNAMMHNGFGTILREAVHDIGVTLQDIWSGVADWTGLAEGDALSDATSPGTALRIFNDTTAFLSDRFGVPKPVTTGLAATGAAIGGALMLGKLTTMIETWLRPSTEAYFEKRMQLLRDGSALKGDVEETRERAILAVARMNTWLRDADATAISPMEMDIARRQFTSVKFAKVLDEVSRLVEESRLAQAERLRQGQLTASSPMVPRDVLREVVMDQMPQVVNPFTDHDPAPVPPQPNPAPGGGGSPPPAPAA